VPPAPGCATLGAVLLPSPRAALLLLPGLVALLAGAPPAAVAALDLALLALVALDAAQAPRPDALRATRRVREPLSAFAPNRVVLSLESASPRPLRLALVDGVPAGFTSSGHRRALVLPPGASAALEYAVVPRARGRAIFGDLHLEAEGPLRLGRRRWRLPLAHEVAVYPDLRGLAEPAGKGAPGPGRVRPRGLREGREFAALRPYLPGDDVRAIDWKATARRGTPVVRETQPERNQTLWLLLDCGRHLSGRLPDGRTKLDHAVDAALALARAAAGRGDRAGAILFGAEVERIVPPGAGRAALGPLAEALHRAEPRFEEPDWTAACEALLARQRRRALAVLLTDLADPDASAALLAGVRRLRRHHLVLVAAVADPELAGAARARPADEAGAFARVAAERILEEREATARRLAADAVRVESAPARDLAAAVVGRYLAVKARGEL